MYHEKSEETAVSVADSGGADVTTAKKTRRGRWKKKLFKIFFFIFLATTEFLVAGEIMEAVDGNRIINGEPPVFAVQTGGGKYVGRFYTIYHFVIRNEYPEVVTSTTDLSEYNSDYYVMTPWFVSEEKAKAKKK